MKKPLSGNPIVNQAVNDLFYELFEKLSDEDKEKLNILEDLEINKNVIKFSSFGSDLIEKK
jgi:hypothetical protein